MCKFWSQIVKRLKSKRRTRSWTYSRLPAGADDITPVVEDTKQFIQVCQKSVCDMYCCNSLSSTVKFLFCIITNLFYLLVWYEWLSYQQETLGKFH